MTWNDPGTCVRAGGAATGDGRTPERDRSPGAAAISEPGRWNFVAPSRVRSRCGRGPPARRNPRVPRGCFPERGCVRGAPAAAGWAQGTLRISTDASANSGLLRLVLGGHSRAPWVAASPLCVHRVAVVNLHRRDCIVAASSKLRSRCGQATRSVVWKQPHSAVLAAFSSQFPLSVLPIAAVFCVTPRPEWPRPPETAVIGGAQQRTRSNDIGPAASPHAPRSSPSTSRQ